MPLFIPRLVIVVLLGIGHWGLCDPALKTQSPDKGKGKILLSFWPSGGQLIWVTQALEYTFLRELNQSPRLQPTSHHQLTPTKCLTKDLSCLLEDYGQRGYDFVFTGTVSKSNVDFNIYETWTRSVVKMGTIPLKPNVTRFLSLRNELLHAIKPIVEPGGVLDQKASWKIAAAITPNQPTQTEQSDKSTQAVAAALIIGGFSLWLLLPILTGFVLIQRKQRVLKSPQTKIIFYLSIGGVLTALLITISALLGAPNSLTNDIAFGPIAFSYQNLRWFLYLGGGFAFGLCILVAVKLVFPGIFGLTRVRHWNILWLFRAWLVLTSVRGFLVVLFVAPLLIGVRTLAQRFDVDSHLTYLFLLPTASLLTYLWYASLLNSLALYLDQEFVFGPKDATNPWHEKIKSYFFAHLKRLGINLFDPLYEKVLFFPSHQSQILAYGTPLAYPRIVIDLKLLEYALGPLTSTPPQPEISAPDTHPPTLGLLVAGQELRPKRRDSLLKKEGAPKRRQAQHQGRHQGQPQGTPNTGNLAYGLMTPATTKESIPLLAEDQRDLVIVDSLLSDHHRAYHSTLSQEEIDYSDPNHRDFLFGLLLHQIGVIKRSEYFFLTPLYVFHHWSSSLPRWIDSTAELIINGFRSLFYKYWAIVSDSYTALNFGLYHFLQYLHLFLRHDSALITQRADPLTLNQVAGRILNLTRLRHTEIEGDSLAQSAKTRIIWLSQYFYTPIPEPRANSRRWVLITVVTIAGLWGTFQALQEAWNYHPIYLKTISEEMNKTSKQPNNLNTPSLEDLPWKNQKNSSRQ